MTASIIHTQWSFGILVFHRTKCLWCLLAPPENEEGVSKSIINNAGIQKQGFSLSSTHGGSYLCFVKKTLASLNSLCLQSLCLYESNKPQTFLCERSSDHSTNRHYTQECNVSIVTAVIARLSTSWWDVLSWCDSRVIVSDLSNRSLIFFKVLPSAMLTWGWQGLGVVLILVAEAPLVEQMNLICSQIKGVIPSKHRDDAVYCFTRLIGLTCKDFTRNSLEVLER